MKLLGPWEPVPTYLYTRRSRYYWDRSREAFGRFKRCGQIYYIKILVDRSPNSRAQFRISKAIKYGKCRITEYFRWRFETKEAAMEKADQILRMKGYKLISKRHLSML